jgi:hypothetical protein
MIGRYFLVLVLLLSSLIVLVGCGCRGERVVFQDVLVSDCAPPCWRGVIPGTTSRQETLNLLKEPPDTEPGLQRIDWGWRCSKYGSMTQVEIYLDSNDMVESITLVDPDTQYTFQSVVDEFGSPTTVLMTPCAPDTDKGFLYLVYPERGLALGSGFVPTLERPWQQPSAEIPVLQWVYFDPIASDLFSPMGEPISGCGMPYANETSPWRGFGLD